MLLLLCVTGTLSVVLLKTAAAAAEKVIDKEKEVVFVEEAAGKSMQRRRRRPVPNNSNKSERESELTITKRTVCSFERRREKTAGRKGKSTVESALMI